LVGGLEYRPSNYLRFTLEGFYKTYNNYPFSIRDSVSLANLGADFGVIGDEPVTSTSNGRSYGIEFLAQQKLNKNFYGILSLTYVVSEFEDKNGNYAASSWDNRTIISLTAGKKFKHDWEAGLKWRFSGGLPYTPYDVDYSSLIYVWDINRQGVLDFDQLNPDRGSTRQRWPTWRTSPCRRRSDRDSPPSTGRATHTPAARCRSSRSSAPPHDAAPVSAPTPAISRASHRASPEIVPSTSDVPHRTRRPAQRAACGAECGPAQWLLNQVRFAVSRPVPLARRSASTQVGFHAR
jgi:hypothetical protein